MAPVCVASSYGEQSALRSAVVRGLVATSGSSHPFFRSDQPHSLVVLISIFGLWFVLTWFAGVADCPVGTAVVDPVRKPTWEEYSRDQTSETNQCYVIANR